MDSWLSEVLQTIQTLVASEQVSYTYKALREIAELDLGLDESDVCQILSELEDSDFRERKKSNITDEWLYIFLVSVESCPIYLKLILRDECLIISFHEDRPNDQNT